MENRAQFETAKLAKFIESTWNTKRIGVFLELKAPDLKVHIEVEKWPLVKATAYEAFGGTFFSRLHEIVNISAQSAALDRFTDKTWLESKVA